MENNEHDEATEPSGMNVHSEQKDWGSIIDYKPLFSADSK